MFVPKKHKHHQTGANPGQDVEGGKKEIKNNSKHRTNKERADISL